MNKLCINLKAIDYKKKYQLKILCVYSFLEISSFILQGSALHEHLSKLGYTDFESVSMPKKTYFEKNRSLNIVKIFIYIIFYNIYF